MYVFLMTNNTDNSGGTTRVASRKKLVRALLEQRDRPGIEQWAAQTPEGVEAIWSTYWRRIIEMAESRVFDIVGHMDLPKKFGYRPSTPMIDLEQKALDAIAAAGMAVEINTSGWHLPADEAYPSPELLCEANRREIPIVISADAHNPQVLARDFPRAKDLAVEAGYTGVVRYAEREAIKDPF